MEPRLCTVTTQRWCVCVCVWGAAARAAGGSREQQRICDPYLVLMLILCQLASSGGDLNVLVPFRWPASQIGIGFRYGGLLLRCRITEPPLSLPSQNLIWSYRPAAGLHWQASTSQNKFILLTVVRVVPGFRCVCGGGDSLQLSARNLNPHSSPLDKKAHSLILKKKKKAWWHLIISTHY